MTFLQLIAQLYFLFEHALFSPNRFPLLRDMLWLAELPFETIFAVIEDKRASPAPRTSAAAASRDGKRRLPVLSAKNPATDGPIIWPAPKLAVIKPITCCGRSPASARALISPSAVNPMKVPPSRTAETQTPEIVIQSMLATTPIASTTHAMA